MVGFESRPFLKRCFDSLERQVRLPDKVVFVDNGSSDRSVEFVSRWFPWVEVIALEQNVGFARANNIAIDSCKTDLCVLLNPDAEAEPAWLDELCNAAERHGRDVAMFACRIHSMKDPTFLESAGDEYSLVGTSLPIGYGDDPAEYLAPAFVFGPSGAAAAYRTDVLKELGGFDQDFFAYYEDADLSFRMNMAGYRCLYVPGAVVKHWGQHASSGFTEGIESLCQRNLEWAYFKNMPSMLMLAGFLDRMLFELMGFLLFARRRRLGILVRAKLDAALAIHRIWKKRKKIQADRRISLVELYSRLQKNWIASRVAYQRARKMAGWNK